MTGSANLTPEAAMGNAGAAAGWEPTGIAQLEPAAWDALRDDGCTAVIAGPGAGKTEFLAQRAAFLLQTGLCPAPRRILAISFKRDSAANLARRIAARIPEHAGRFVSLTFDAFTKGLVDRFGSALPQPWALNGPYEIKFWTQRDQQDFVTGVALNASGKLQLDLYGLPGAKFLTDVVGDWALPTDPPGTASTAAKLAALAWWHEHYLRPGTQHVDFVMLNRLAELLARCRPQLGRALRITYPYVFVDEFQDTTGAQLSFLASVFGDATVTAVGDRKQRIMGFAGALPDALRRYAVSFAATEYQLTWNFRSSDGLVLLQHIIASRLDPEVTQAVSKAAPEAGHVPASMWTFDSAAREAEYIAERIARDIARSGRQPADFALVARQKVADYEQRLAAALAGRGISLRNDDVFHGQMRLQDLLKHEATRLILGVLRLAAEPSGLADVWLEVKATLARIDGTIDDDDAARRLGDDLSRLTGDLRAWLEAIPVRQADPGKVVDRAVDAVGRDHLAGYLRSSYPGDDISLILRSLAERLRHVMPRAQNWAQAFVDVEAVDAVTLMTIHRSKGLEYHTVFFLGLDDDQWWAYQRDADEATSAFFVGLSRAAHRLVFTSTNPAARSGKIASLYQMLDEAGVPETHVQ
jgi:DNA helicase II / ATP-dependent DNA helicase PcrA